MGNELPLLGARSTVTRLPDVLVRRPRLDALLGDRRRRPVTLVSAPPGAGKTTLVTSWLTTRRRRDVVPLTVDDRDNERGQLAGVIVAALVDRGAIPLGPVGGGLRGTTLLDAAFDQLERRGERRILVLDDVQELTSRDALSSLGYLVERAPETLQVVLCSRADPPIRLARLRLGGRLGEIRSSSLAFDLTETHALLEAQGLQLTHGQVRALWRRTDGWVAGLCLAACALRADADPTAFVDSAAGTESAIADYLLRELFTRQDESIQRFMLRTSVAERLTPELAAELTDDKAAPTRLVELERNGVLRAELGDRTWYRYHSLFAGLLEARLRHQQRELADELHRRAAAWFVVNGLFDEAEAHARAAGDWPLVGQLAGQRWVARTLVGVEPVGDLLAGVPAYAMAGSEGLVVLAAADACLRGDRAAATAHRAVLHHLAAGPGTPEVRTNGHGARRRAGSVRAEDGVGWGSGRRSLADGLPLARPLLDIAHASAFGPDAAGRSALAQLRAAAQEASDPGLEQLAELRGIGFDLDEGRLPRVRRRAARLAPASESTWIGAEALALLALAEAVDGEIDAGLRDGERVLGKGSPARGVGRATAMLALALCHASRGEHRLAFDQVAAVELPLGAGRWLRAIERAVRAALGIPGSAFVGLGVDEAAHPLVARALVGLGVLEAVDATGRVRLLGGPLEEAVLLARQRWHANKPAGVVTVLQEWPPGVAPCHPRTEIERDCLLALATAAGDGDAAAPVETLRQALVAAERTGIRAPLLVLAPDLADLLEAHAEDLDGHEGFALELVDRARTSPAPAFVEPLTEREAAVLRHLPTLMSNHEIAAAMHVSVNTVKTHLKSLYRKLGVASRRDAVGRGRALELV